MCALKLNGRNSETYWKTLQGRTFTGAIVFLSHYAGNAFSNGPVFANCTTLIIDQCDKNFVYYWLNRATFPSVTKVYLNAHPCDWSVFKRGFEQYFLHEKWARHAEKEATIISDAQYQEVLIELGLN
jgi:hypothetical protein